MKTTVILALLSLIYIRLLLQAQAANDTPDPGPLPMSNTADGQLAGPAELDHGTSGTRRREKRKIARLRNEIIALNASLITYMSQAETSIGNDVELLHASIVAVQLETVDTQAAYRQAKSLIADLDTLRQHAIANLTLPSDYVPPDVPSTQLAGASTDTESVLASTYEHAISIDNLFEHIAEATLDARKKLEELAAGREKVNIVDMFEIQMLMNHLSQLSDMVTSVVSASNLAISNMARNVKS
jgi:Family of unknown function (DUF5407)